MIRCIKELIIAWNVPNPPGIKTKVEMYSFCKILKIFIRKEIIIIIILLRASVI